MFTKIFLIFALSIILPIFATTENPISHNEVIQLEEGCFYNTCRTGCSTKGFIGGFCMFDKCNCYPKIGKFKSSSSNRLHTSFLQIIFDLQDLMTAIKMSVV